jgi:hypothetical protein
MKFSIYLLLLTATLSLKSTIHAHMSTSNKNKHIIYVDTEPEKITRPDIISSVAGFYKHPDFWYTSLYALSPDFELPKNRTAGDPREANYTIVEMKKELDELKEMIWPGQDIKTEELVKAGKIYNPDWLNSQLIVARAAYLGEYIKAYDEAISITDGRIGTNVIKEINDIIKSKEVDHCAEIEGNDNRVQVITPDDKSNTTFQGGLEPPIEELIAKFNNLKGNIQNSISGEKEKNEKLGENTYPNRKIKV